MCVGGGEGTGQWQDCAAKIGGGKEEHVDLEEQNHKLEAVGLRVKSGCQGQKMATPSLTPMNQEPCVPQSPHLSRETLAFLASLGCCTFLVSESKYDHSIDSIIETWCPLCSLFYSVCLIWNRSKVFPRLSIVTSKVVTSPPPRPWREWWAWSRGGHSLGAYRNGDSSLQGITRHPHIKGRLRSSVVKCIQLLSNWVTERWS